MTDIFVAGDNIISSLGFTAEENFSNLKNNITGIKIKDDGLLYPTAFPVSQVDSTRLETEFEKIGNTNNYTRLEKMFILSITDALKQNKVDITSPRTVFIFSTTKGNIDLLEPAKKNLFEEDRLKLWGMSKEIAKYFNNSNEPIVVSNACISGVLAVVIAQRLINDGVYDNAIVAGGDIVSEFVVAGFQSFKSLSAEPCKPFDINRDGLSLGEGCATIILTNNQNLFNSTNRIKVMGGASSNDANHISGPSRTGDGLYFAIKNAMDDSGITANDIHYISAHGTATSFNDEMESKAISWAKLNEVPVNSLKGYFGHTLGGAGAIESVIGIHSLRENLLINTKGYSELGVPEKINVINETRHAELKNFLKIASGFGGCNAAVIFSKDE